MPDFKTELKNPKVNLEIVSTTETVDLDSQALLSLLRTVLDSPGVVDIAHVEFTGTAPALTFYTLTITVKDGRVWNQTLTFANAVGDDDPKVTFNVPAPGFKRSEFLFFVNVRQALIALKSVFNVKKIEITVI